MGSPSSSDDDGDEEWKTAINSIAAAAVTSISNGTTLARVPGRSASGDNDGDDPNLLKTRLPKHFQIKAEKLLDEIVERNLEFVDHVDNVRVPENDALLEQVGIRLFKNAPVGIVFDRVDEPRGQMKKPRILPGEEIDEKSKKFKRQLKSVVVDGIDIIAVAKASNEKSLARLEAKEAQAKAAAKKEEERVTELKRLRGERWLPSIAKVMQPKPQEKRKTS